jgi:menaquinone-specific isochorismate synthase
LLVVQISTSVTTTRLGSHLPLLELLPDQNPLTWVRNGEGLVGWGVQASTKVKGPNRFEDARKWWHQQLDSFEVNNEVHGPGTGPVLFTSFSFDEDEESELVIPKVIVGTRNQSTWITWFGNENQPKLIEVRSLKFKMIHLIKLCWQEKLSLMLILKLILVQSCAT